MAEKKSWRDYLDSVQNGESTNSENTGTWRDYLASESTSGENTSGGWRDQITNAVRNDATNRVNNWLNNHNSYISGYQKRYSGRKYSYEDSYVSDSASWLDNVSKQADELEAERQNILSYLDQYKGHLGEDWVRNVRDTLTGARDTHSKIIAGATKDNEYWSKFTPNEEQTAAGYTSESLYKEWQTGQKQYAEDLAFDVDAATLELEKLKQEREAYLADQEEKRKQAESDESFWDSLGRWLGTTPDTTIPLAGVSGNSGSNNPAEKYDKQISALEDRIERAKYVQGYEGFMDNIESEDYIPNSQYVSTRTDVAKEDARWGLYNNMYDESKLFGDFLYDYINRNQDALDVAMVNDTATNAYFLGLDKGFLKTMSDDEIGVYNYLYKTQGTESANAYLSFIESDLEGRRRAQEQAFWAGYAKSDPVGSSVFSTLISPLKGLSYLGQAADMLDDGTMEQNAGYNRFSYIPSSIRSQVSTTIENSGKWGEVGSFAYNTGMSMADFLFTTAVSGGNQSLSLAIMGTGAAADATLAAKDRGLDDGDAFALGTIAGLAEVAMEKISLGAWLEGDMTEGALRYVLKNALSEGAEEAGTSVINLLADVIIAGDKSEWNMAMQAYIEEGKSPEEAFGLVAAEQAAKIGLDALGGIFSGAAIGGGTYAGTSAVAGVKYGNVGKNKVEAQKLVSEGLELNPNSQYMQKMQDKVNNGKNLSGMQVRNILAANQEQITANDLEKIQKAAENRLNELGQTKDVARVAEIATKWATGQEITRAEKKLLTHSEYGSRVANELLPENIASDDYSSGWAEEIGTKKVNAAAYNKKAIRELIDAIANAEDPATYKSLEERVGTDGRFGVSESGEVTIRETDEAIDLAKAEVVNVGDSQVTFKLEDGREVYAGDIDFANDDQSYIVSAVSDIENITPAAATAIIRDVVDATKPVGAQLNGIDEAYTYGYHGYSESDLKAGNFTTGLTSEQMMSAYKLGQSARKLSDSSTEETFKKMRTAAQAQAEKAVAEGNEAPKAKNLTISYNEGGGKVVSIDKAGIKDAKRSGAVEVAKILHKMGLGTRVEFFSSHLSKTLKDKNGNPARVFLDDNGVEQIAYSGVYRKSDGTIRVDLNAYNGKGLTLNALSHELTHFIQQWSKEKYKVLADFLVKSYEKTDMTMHDRVLREQARLEGIRGEEVSYDEAFDEVVANAMSKMFDDGKLVEKLTELKAQDETLARKLWDGFKKIIAKFLGIYENAGPLFRDTADIMAMKETFEQLQNMFAEALVDASGNYQASLTVSESQTLTEAGIGFDEDTRSVYSLHFSTAYKDTIQVGKKTFDTEAIAKIVAKGTGRSIEDARKWVKSELTIANMVMANPEFLDFEADNRYEAIKKNSDYPQGTVDLSNLCPKREEFTAMFDRLQKKYPNKLFTAQDVAEMRKILASNDITVACGACFVEDRRQLLGEIAETYINMWKEAVESGKPLQKTNAAGVKSDLLVTKALAKQYGLTPGTKIMATDTYIPTQYDLTTYEGFKLLEKNHPTIAMGFNRYNNSRGQQSARLIEGRAEYNRQILGWSDAKVRSVNNNGGLRIFSFSDFEVVHLLDLVQVIIDCAAKGVKIQGYTKIPAFAKLVRGTGLKLNRSLIPKGDYGYHMENGKVVLDYDTTEGIDINDDNFIDESDNPDVGNIVIGINPTQIGAAMLDPFIDYIIPFHSNKAKEILRKLGTGEWVNYKESQHEKDISTGTSSKHNVNIYTEVINKYHPTNKVEFVEAFLKECKRQGKIPRYSEFLNVDANGDYAYREGYHKLLVDFKMFDAEGNILPQGNITPSLDENFMMELLNAEIDRKQNYEFPQKVYDAIDKKFGENSLDNSSDGNENKLTENQERGEVNDNGRIREVSLAEEGNGSINRGRKSSDRGSYPKDIGNAQETPAWRDLDSSVRKRSIRVVNDHIKNSKNSDEIYYYLVSLTGKSESEITPYSYRKAVESLSEKLYTSAINDHSVIFENNWKFMGETTKLRNAILEATKEGQQYSSQETDADNAPTFYSQMGKVVEGMKQEKFGASSVISMLTGRGVKAEEIRWSGIQAFLEGKKSVTKQELRDFINSSMLQIEEDMYGGGIGVEFDPITTAGHNFPNAMNVMHGGEIIDTLVYDGSKGVWNSQKLGISFDDGEDAYQHYNKSGKSTNWSDHKLDGGEKYRELVFKIPGANYSNMAMQAHWGSDAQGVLAHARMQDFDTEGGKMLFIEEIQSDWHNAGQKGGYRSDLESVTEEIRTLEAQLESLAQKYVEREKQHENFLSRYWEENLSDDEYKQEWESWFADGKTYFEQKKELYEKIAKLKRDINTTAPEAPFKGNYHEYVLKRLIRMAAEEGYDSIGWTTADIQMDRWNPGRGTNEVMGITNAKNPDAVAFEDGYRIEYDQDIPKFLKKYGKQWGAEVGKTNIDTRGVTEWEQDMVEKGIIELVPHETEVWSMDITDAMKKSVLKEGQALYSSQETDLDSNGKQIVTYKDAIANLSKYSDADLRSIADQLTEGTFSFAKNMSRESMENVLKSTLSILAKEDPMQTVRISYAETPSAANVSQGKPNTSQNSKKELVLKLRELHQEIGDKNKSMNNVAQNINGVQKLWDQLGKGEITAQQYDEQLRGKSPYYRELFDQTQKLQKDFDGLVKELEEIEGKPWKSLRRDVLYGSEFRFSTQETDNISNRDLLANAFEGIVQNSEEYKMIQEYKDSIKLLNEYEVKLSKLNAEIRKMLFDPTVERDAKKLKELQDEAKSVAKNINRHDKKLLSLEASEPLRKVIEHERKKEAQKTKDHVKELLQNKKARAEQTEYRHKIRKTIRDLDKLLNRGNKKLNVKEDMKGFVSKALELADYLFTDHISNDELIRRGIDADLVTAAGKAHLVKETEDILTKLYDEADTLTDEEFTRLDAKRKANEEKMRDLLTAQRNRRLDVPVYNLFNDLVTEYASLKNSTQDAVKAAYNDEVERLLRTFVGDADSDRAKTLKNMRVADMTTEELWKLYNAYTMVLTTVRDANKFHAKGITETIEQRVGRIAGDFGSRKIPEKKFAIATQKLANKIGWSYEKLYYALDRIGSEAFTELIMNLADSENIVMQDIMEAMAFRDEIVEKYGFNNWDVNKEIDREFLDNTGKKFKMTLGQMMSLYAYSRREGAWDHIEYGGFVFGEAALTNPKPADSYKLSKNQCEAITNLLTKEQKAYAEDMQKFLSETMGAKGNEVSMKLYGIKMFGEKNYFPIHIAGQFKAQAQESQAKAAAGFSSMSNAGFTHAQNPNAKAPFVLEGFNEVWSDHVNEMSRYHGTVPALEDIRRVMNRSTYSDSVAESQSIKQLMENHFGKEAVEYFDNLYREANSGAITDKLQNKAKKLLSLFRKNSVAYSLSVIVQQPSALVRAYAMIDKKYFGFKGFGTITSGVAKAVSSKWNPAYANAYNEMLKYAPGVTMTKEIGGFDTATGGSIRSYLLDTNKNLKQKWKTGTAVEKGKAVLDLVDDNAIANLPNVADKIAWIEIWNACKREAVAKNKDLAPGSEEFMQAVGERFTEVIRATQVYDSIFAKSPMLKSKNLYVQMLVSFMNEPNTVANMVEKSVRDATKGDWKGGLRTGAAVIYSIIFNNVLKSIVYAMRDDDEDETYIEKYIEAITGGMMSDLNALNYIPLVRDAVSLAQGYDVERADMAIVADALDAFGKVIKNGFTDKDDMTEEELVEFDKKVTEANWKLVESLAAFLGIPVKNIRREIKGVIDHARIASSNAGLTNAQSAWDKVYDAVIDSIPFMQNKNTKQDKLYDAIISGDQAYIDRIKSTYNDDSAYQSAVRKALRENEPRIHEAAQARYDGNAEEYKRIFREIQKEGKFTFDDIMSAINSEESKIRNGVEPDKVTSQYSASDFVESVVLGDSKSAQAIRDDIIATKVANGDSQEEAEKEFASNVATGIRDAYSSGLLDEAGAENMLIEYAGKDEEEAASKVSYWTFCEEHPQYDLSESNVKDYKEFAEPAEIPLDVFVQYINGTKGLATKRDEWGDVEVTKREQVLEVIDSLDLTWEQKDALYLAAGYSESTIWDVPW